MRKGCPGKRGLQLYPGVCRPRGHLSTSRGPSSFTCKLGVCNNEEWGLGDYEAHSWHSISPCGHCWCLPERSRLMVTLALGASVAGGPQEGGGSGACPHWPCLACMTGYFCAWLLYPVKGMAPPYAV